MSGYVSPMDAAVSGENVLSQFFKQTPMPNNPSVVMDDSASLGLQEVSTVEEKHILAPKNGTEEPLEIQDEKKVIKKKKKWRKGKKSTLHAAQGDQDSGQKLTHHTSKRQENRAVKTNMKTG